MRRKNKIIVFLVVLILIITAFQFSNFDKKWQLFEKSKNAELFETPHRIGYPINFKAPRAKLGLFIDKSTTDANLDDKWLKITKLDKRHRPEFVESIIGLNNDNLRLVANHSIPPWFSEKDVLRLEMMSQNKVLGLKQIPYRVKISRVVYDTGIQYTLPINTTKIECREECAVVKTLKDTYEIFAFHLDRVLGINRSLPMVARTKFPKFPENPNITLHDGLMRPVVWFEPNIVHEGLYQGDQNSFDITWPGYLRILKARCFDQQNTNRDPTICVVPIRLIEWARMAILDFLIQNYDRVDRNCCGYHNKSEGESCFTQKFNLECDDDPEKLMLVHIMASYTDKSRLVLIDNAGNPGRSLENLNYKLLAGFEELPEHSIAVIKSGLLQSMLQRSLYADKLYWDAIGLTKMNDMIKTVEQRSLKLLDFMKEQNINTVPDY
ncbi:Golgi-associated kinase 1A-like [Glandiceps talaboti]